MIKVERFCLDGGGGDSLLNNIDTMHYRYHNHKVLKMKPLGKQIVSVNEPY